MMWSKLNKADKTLLFAGACFFFFLCLNIEYPDNVFAEGLLFCSEAALVGGIADWFAVTAIFEKPLGFPYHTAILPRRREQFIEATGKMLQKEFFSRKKLLSKVKKIDFVAVFTEWLQKEENAKFVADRLIDFFEDMKKKHSGKIAKNFKESFDNYPVNNMLKSFGEELKNPESPKGAEVAGLLFTKLREYASTPEAKSRIENALEDYQNSKLQVAGGMAAMMAGFAQSMNMINIPEASMLAQNQMISLLDKLLQENSEEQRNLLSALGECLLDFTEDEEKSQSIKSLWRKLVSEDIIEKGISSITIEGAGKDAHTADDVKKIAMDIISHWIAIMSKEEKLHNAVNKLFYDAAARSVLQAQELLAEIVRKVLSSLTDKQINHLVYDKAEPDLLWIRMNGSIVGAGIGAVIFAVMAIL